MTTKVTFYFKLNQFQLIKTAFCIAGASSLTTKDKIKYLNSLIKNIAQGIGIVVEDKKLIGLPFDSLTN